MPTDHAPLSLRREALSSDSVAVWAMTSATRFFRPDEIAIAVELVEERLQRGAASGYEFLFAEAAGELVGYACYGLIGCTLGSYDLYWIVVDPAHQRRGIGRLLLEAAEAAIAQAGGRRVYIETSNRPVYLPTREFYLRCGYRLEALLPDYYADGDDKAILVKRLPGTTAGP